MRLFITTNPGLEDVVVEELLARAQAADLGPIVAQPKPFGFGGQVWVEGGQRAALCEVAMQLRSVHHVFEPLHRFDVPLDGALQHIEAEV